MRLLLRLLPHLQKGRLYGLHGGTPDRGLLYPGLCFKTRNWVLRGMCAISLRYASNTKPNHGSGQGLAAVEESVQYHEIKLRREIRATEAIEKRGVRYGTV